MPRPTLYSLRVRPAPLDPRAPGESGEQLRHARKMDEMGRLAGGIAHDFNNVLAAIKGSAQLALLEVPEDAPVREELEQIDRAATRAASLAHQLLALSRELALEPRGADPDPVVGSRDATLFAPVTEPLRAG